MEAEKLAENLVSEKSGLTLNIVFRRYDDGSVIAECLEIPGCLSQGGSEEEAKANIADAINACLAVILEDAIKSRLIENHELGGNRETRDSRGKRAICFATLRIKAGALPRQTRMLRGIQSRPVQHVGQLCQFNLALQEAEPFDFFVIAEVDNVTFGIFALVRTMWFPRLRTIQPNLFVNTLTCCSPDASGRSESAKSLPLIAARYAPVDGETFASSLALRVKTNLQSTNASCAANWDIARCCQADFAARFPW